MVDFCKTRMGQRLIEGTLPALVDALADVAKELKRANDLKERELSGPVVDEAELAAMTDAERAAAIEGVAPAIIRGGRTEVELSETFAEVVGDGADWKEPIDHTMYSTKAQAELIRFAIRYYHGVEPAVTRVGDDRHRFESPGYQGGRWCACEAGPPCDASGRCPECGDRVPTYR